MNKLWSYMQPNTPLKTHRNNKRFEKKKNPNLTHELITNETMGIGIYTRLT